MDALGMARTDDQEDEIKNSQQKTTDTTDVSSVEDCACKGCLISNSFIRASYDC